MAQYGLWASLYQVYLCFDIAPTIDLYRLGTLLLCIGRSWAGLPYQNLLFICELSSPLVFLLSSSGKSFISIRIDAFIQRENYRRALLLDFVP